MLLLVRAQAVHSNCRDNSGCNNMGNFDCNTGTGIVEGNSTRSTRESSDQAVGGGACSHDCCYFLSWTFFDKSDEYQPQVKCIKINVDKNGKGADVAVFYFSGKGVEFTGYVEHTRLGYKFYV